MYSPLYTSPCFLRLTLLRRVQRCTILNFSVHHSLFTRIFEAPRRGPNTLKSSPPGPQNDADSSAAARLFRRRIHLANDRRHVRPPGRRRCKKIALSYCTPGRIGRGFSLSVNRIGHASPRRQPDRTRLYDIAAGQAGKAGQGKEARKGRPKGREPAQKKHLR